MKLDFEKLSGWELTKAIYLVKQAKVLGMALNGYGEIDVNPNSGYTYLWSEDYPFTLYMEIDCRLNEHDIWVLYTDSDNGDEIEKRLSEFEDIDAIYTWIDLMEESKQIN
jgi:hypothetical protein